jgi:hypothetical protein
MIKISYTKYSFTIPVCPSEQIYEVWRKTFPLVPNLDIEPKYKTFIQLNPAVKVASKIIGISILALSMIYLILMKLFSLIKPGGFIDIIYAFLFVVFLFVITYLIISTLSSYNSYRSFRSDSKRHYAQLKELIIKSYNYSDFQLNYNAQFRNKQNVNTSAYDKLNQKLNKLFDY